MSYMAENLHIIGKYSNFNAKKNETGKVIYGYGFDFESLFKETKRVYELERVFEYSEDIRPLLAEVRRQLISGKCVDVALPRVDGLWNWEKEKFIELLAAAGIKCTEVSKNSSSKHLRLNCNKKNFESYLNSLHLPPPNARVLLVTTESSDYRVTGGIGSYVKECANFYGNSGSILMIDNSKDLNKEIIKNKQWFSLQYFLSDERIDEIEESNYDTLPDMVLEAVASINCLYPELEVIEAQEMLLASVIRAKKFKLIQLKAKLVTVCHGSSFHLAKAKHDVIDAENIHVAYKEKYTIENSDVTIFPTNFLRKSYEDCGLSNLYDSSRVVKRLPFDIGRLPKGKRLKEYTKLLYIGKTSTVKGFDLFLNSIINLYKDNPEVFDRITEILVVATTTKIEEPKLQDMFRYVEGFLPIKMMSLPREELLKLLADYAEDTLALVTYRGDNHPLAVLELMAIGHDFIAANAGGTPELIPDGFESDYLIEPNEVSFSEAVKSALHNPSIRSIRIRQLMDYYRLQQVEINNLYSAEWFEGVNALGPAPAAPESKKSRLSAFIIDNGEKEKHKITEQSLKLQTRQPDSIIKVSESEYQQVVSSTKGSVICLYPGDTLRHSALEIMEKALYSCKNTALVFGYELVPVYNGVEYMGVREFHPVSPQLGSVFFQEKYGRRCVGLFNSDYYANDGLSDWQKAIKASCQGGGVQIVPEVLLDLVPRVGYPELNPATEANNLIHSFTVLPTFDAYILHSELKRFDYLYWGNNLMNHMENTYIRRDQIESQLGIPPVVISAARYYRRYTPLYVRKLIYKGYSLAKYLRSRR